jgi:hypothetical protein
MLAIVADRSPTGLRVSATLKAFDSERECSLPRSHRTVNRIVGKLEWVNDQSASCRHASTSPARARL